MESDDQKELEAQQYLTFVLSDEEYAIGILKVQEIRSFESTTRIPGTPEYLLGVINLRGSVVPIVDLRIKFNLGKAEINTNAVVILIKVAKKKGESTIGIVVDAVSDVYTINNEDVTEAPDLASNSVKSFVTGLATVGEKMIILLDIEALISKGILEDDIFSSEDSQDSSEEETTQERSTENA